MNWFAAKAHCEKKEGGKLVEIDSEEENNALAGEIERANHTTDSDGNKIHFWIGLSDNKSEGDWRLASNGLKPSYLNWQKNRPTNERDQDCARLMTRRTGLNNSRMQIAGLQHLPMGVKRPTFMLFVNIIR